MMNYKNILNIRAELRRYLVKYPKRGLAVGMSGGIDSTVCAALASPVCQDLGRSLIGRSITIESNTDEERNRAMLAGTAFCTEFDEDNLTAMYEAIRDFVWGLVFTKISTGQKVDLPAISDFDRKVINGNIKARLRMTVLYHIAGFRKCIVLSTDNLTEHRLGFWTLNGDVGDLGMIQEVDKTGVYEIAECLRDSYTGSTNQRRKEAMHKGIICDATDGLGISSTDVDQIIPDWRDHYTTTRKVYEAIDDIFNLWFGGQQSDVIDSPVIARHNRTAYKRNNPYNFPLSLIMGERQDD